MQIECCACGEKTEDASRDEFGNEYCEACYDYETSQCDCCGCIYPVDNIRTTWNNCYCVDCFDRLYIYCSHCDDVVSRDDAYGFMCPDCYDDYGGDEEGDGIFSYSWKPNPHFFGSQFLGNSNLLFTPFMGFELEIEGDKAKTSPSYLANVVNKIRVDSNQVFYCKEDGSINYGLEVVSHPMTLEFMKNHQEHLLSFLEFARNNKFRGATNTDCGMHVHVDRRAFKTQYHNLRFSSFFTRESNFEYLKKISQRSQGSLNCWANLNKLSLNVEIKKAKGSTQYESRNACYKNNKTYEIRLFKSNLRNDRVLKNLEFCHALWKASRPLSGIPGATLDASQMIDFVDKNKMFYPNLHSYHKESRLAA